MPTTKPSLLIQRDEHDEANLAKRVDVISAPTVYAVTNGGGGGVTTVYQGGAPWQSLATVVNFPATQTVDWLSGATISVANELKSLATVTQSGSLEVASATDFEGAPISVGTTAVEVTFSGTTKTIFIQADHDNTGNIWVGKATVDLTGANATARLDAGEAISFDMDDSSNPVYVVSDAASQKVFKMALL